jgi:hypothetical protein
VGAAKRFDPLGESAPIHAAMVRNALVIAKASAGLGCLTGRMFQSAYTSKARR